VPKPPAGERERAKKLLRQSKRAAQLGFERGWPRSASATPLVGLAVICHFLSGSVAVADAAKRKAYGENLSRECTSCHRLDGIDNGIPSIVGWDSDQFVITMKFYQEGLRDNAAMMSVAKSLDEEQLQALASYFASLPAPAKRTSANPR
jgi:cytochrome c